MRLESDEEQFFRTSDWSQWNKALADIAKDERKHLDGVPTPVIAAACEAGTTIAHVAATAATTNNGIAIQEPNQAALLALLVKVGTNALLREIDRRRSAAGGCQDKAP